MYFGSNQDVIPSLSNVMDDMILSFLYVQNCLPGCVCDEEYILDEATNKCVRPESCPCLSGGSYYNPGDTITVECNTWSVTITYAC